MQVTPDEGAAMSTLPVVGPSALVDVPVGASMVDGGLPGGPTTNELKGVRKSLKLLLGHCLPAASTPVTLTMYVVFPRRPAMLMDGAVLPLVRQQEEGHGRQPVTLRKNHR